MLEIIINGESLDLIEGVSANFSIENPLFSEEIRPIEYSYPFKIPLSPKNKRILEFRNRIDNFSTKKEYEAAIHIDGMFFRNGIIIIKKPLARFVDIVFKNKEYKVEENIKGVSVSDLMDKYSIANKSLYDWLILDTRYGIQFSININGKNYGAQSNFAIDIIVPQINADYSGNPAELIVENGAFGTKRYLKLNHNSIHFFDVKINDRATIIEKNITTTQDQNATLAFVKNIVENGHEAMCFPFFWFPDFYKGNNPLYLREVNYYYGGEQLLNAPSTEEWINTFVPQIKVKYILEKIIKKMGFESLSGGFADTQDFAELTQFNNLSIDKIDENDTTNSFDTLIDLSKMIEDTDARTYFNEFLHDFGQYITFDEHTIIMHNKKDQLLAPTIDWTNRTDIDYALDKSTEYDSFCVKYDKDDTDRYGKESVFDFGTGDYTFQLHFTTFANRNFSIPDKNDFCRSIAYGGHGSSEELGTGIKKPKRMFFFYRGLKPSRYHSVNYPYAASDTKDQFGNTIGDLDLNLANGFYERLLLEVINLATQPTLTISVHLNIGDILTLMKWQKTKRRITTSEGTADFIIKKVNFKAYSNREISKSQITLTRYK